MKNICTKYLAIYTLLGAITSLLSVSVNAQVITTIEIESDSSQTQTDFPVTFGQIFKVGDVPAGQTLQGGFQGSPTVTVDIQVDKKAVHADGSLRHAIISLLAPAGQTQALELSASAPISSGIPVVIPGNIISADNDNSNDFSTVVEITIPATGATFSASPINQLLADLADNDNNQSYITWLKGDIVSEWVVVTPFTSAAGAELSHLMARFNIRAYASGQVRVSTIIENNWTFQEAPSDIEYDVDIKIAGQSVFQQSALIHVHHARWRKVFWYNSDPSPVAMTTPGVHLSHDATYMMASNAIPNYNPNLTVLEQTLVDTQTAWEANDDIMDIGLALDYMPASGAHDDIGPLPRWTVNYLLSMDKRAKDAAIGTGVQAGSWQIHYRDKATDLPLSIAIGGHPNLTTHPNHNGGGELISDLEDYIDISEEEFAAASVRNTRFKRKHKLSSGLGDLSFNANDTLIEILPKCIGGGTCNNPNLTRVHDTAHQPSLSFVPYLVTGDYYHLEELHFWATANLLRTSPSNRGNDKGWLDGWQQVRGQAWSLRTLGHAAYITPDSHPMKGYFEGLVANNIARYKALYVNGDPVEYSLGFLDDPYIAKNNGRGIAPWMDDFFTWSAGYLVGLGFTDALPLLEWKARFPVGRMTMPDYCWVYSALYTLNISGSAIHHNNPNYRDLFYTSFNDLYANNVPLSVQASSCGSQAMVDANNAFVDNDDHNGLLDPDTPFTRKLTQANEIGGLPDFAAGFVSNMQPALAIAADLGVVGAGNAWTLFDNRSIKPNYNSHSSRGFFNWDIVPLAPVIELAMVANDTLDLTLESNQWNMLSLPCTPMSGEDTVADIFAFDGDSGSDWAVYRYSTPSYVAVNATDILEQGVGYWVIQVNDNNDPFTIAVPQSCDITPVLALEKPLDTVASSNAWSLLGYPFNEGLAWGDLSIIDNDSCLAGCTPASAEGFGVFNNEGWHYNPSTGQYEALTVNGLDRWQGFWVATLGSADGKAPKLSIPLD